MCQFDQVERAESALADPGILALSHDEISYDGIPYDGICHCKLGAAPTSSGSQQTLVRIHGADAGLGTVQPASQPDRPQWGRSCCCTRKALALGYGRSKELGT